MQVNFNTGSDANDYLHGWLNYQIEHHMFPDLSMLSYQVCACSKTGLERGWGDGCSCVSVRVRARACDACRACVPVCVHACTCVGLKVLCHTPHETHTLNTLNPKSQPESLDPKS